MVSIGKKRLYVTEGVIDIVLEIQAKRFLNGCWADVPTSFTKHL